MSVPAEDTPDVVRSWAPYARTSPLYTRLVEVVASDPDLMDVLNQIEHTPRPNMLFAGVQFLISRGGGEELGAYYPNFSTDPHPLDSIDSVFRDFVLANADELIEIGRTRYTQTNECRRCVALLPAIWSLPVDQFHLIDLGTSAGLNLRLDHYRYRWGPVTWGPDSPVDLVAESRGGAVVPADMTILSRTGLDLSPIDPDDAEARLWLEALIWPEHHERRDRLRAALQLATEIPVETRAGNALETLGPVLDDLPAGQPAVVMNSFVLNQFTTDQREQILATIEKGRGNREIFRVSFESIGREDGTASIETDRGSGWETIGQAWPHGDWIELYARP